LRQDRQALFLPTDKTLFIAYVFQFTLDSYHEARIWLNAHRFYVNVDQCERLNVAISRLDALPKRVGLIYLTTELFEENVEMDPSYLTN
jgi:hypothetical protein